MTRVSHPKPKKKNHDAKIHYTYATNDNVIKMIKLVERELMRRPQRDEEAKHDVPKLVLQTLKDSSSLSEILNAMTREQSKVVLHTAQDPKPNASPKLVGSLTVSSYDLVHQLQKTLA